MHIITDAQLLEVSGGVHVDGTDIGSSDHFLAWMELGQATKTSKNRKRVIRRWHLEVEGGVKEGGWRKREVGRRGRRMKEGSGSRKFFR